MLVMRPGHASVWKEGQDSNPFKYLNIELSWCRPYGKYLIPTGGDDGGREGGTDLSLSGLIVEPRKSLVQSLGTT